MRELAMSKRQCKKTQVGSRATNQAQYVLEYLQGTQFGLMIILLAVVLLGSDYLIHRCALLVELLTGLLYLLTKLFILQSFVLLFTAVRS